MAVILSGDFHSSGFGEAEVLKTKYLGIFCSLHGIKLPDIHYHIILGDGGALSVDQDMREPYESWWPEELLSPQEKQELLSSTKGKTYDAVLAHTAPFSRLPDIFENRNFNDSGYPVDPTTQIYDRLIETVDSRDWYFGHFHRNTDKTIKGISYHCLYKRIMLLK